MRTPEHVETAGYLGIAPDRAVNYHCDSEGTHLNYEVVGQAVAAVRCSGSRTTASWAPRPFWATASM